MESTSAAVRQGDVDMDWTAGKVKPPQEPGGSLHDYRIRPDETIEKRKAGFATRAGRALFGTKKFANSEPANAPVEYIFGAPVEDISGHSIPTFTSNMVGQNLDPMTIQALHNSSLETRLQSLYSQSVISTSANTGIITVNLACLSRIRLHRLQKKLVGDAITTKYDKELPEASLNTSMNVATELDRKQSNIQEYVQAFRDHEYITDCALRGKGHDPWLVSSFTPSEHLIIRECGQEYCEKAADQCLVEDDLGLKRPLPTPSTNQNWDLFGGSRNTRNKKEAFEQFLERVGMAIIGGTFLIGPMLVMVLVPGKNTPLITASVCVFAFAIVISWILEKKFDVLSGTAAYAAVLVMFVGTSTGAAAGGK
ncbi:hypothetical protein VTL71DRAFT_12345 [Oculimacula yallundae]|uniref:DUF6594 domain-containing protein n=1 Tax=Oculimacula yallundae TaxID=86028 RepID=A0ABR4CMQ2_9HELO